MLAHLRRDVRSLNDLARGKLIERSVLEGGHAFRTADGKRRFAVGNQIVFLQNELGVKNGMIGKVVEAEPRRFVPRSVSASIISGSGRSAALSPLPPPLFTNPTARPSTG